MRCRRHNKLVLALALVSLGASFLLGCSGSRTVLEDSQIKRDGPTDAGPRADRFIPPDLPATTPDGSTTTKSYNFPANLMKKVDILFVVDNSASMAQEQQALTQTFPQFVDMLASMSGGMPDVHIGVISSDLGAGNYALPSCEVNGGDGGKLMNTPRKAGCIPPQNPYISHVGGVTNVPGAGSGIQKVKSAFSCIAEIGTGGCGFEQTIESARRALDPKLNANPGFIRNDAMLVVIFVSDEDDCSAQKPQLFDPNQNQINDPLGPLTSFRCFEFGVTCQCSGGPCTRTTVGPRTNCKPFGNWLHTIQSYIIFFKGLKPAGQVVMAALAGPTTPVNVALNPNPMLKYSCELPPHFQAVPAVRFKALLDGFGTTSFFNTICSNNYGPSLKKLGTQITAQLGGACL